jgi:hypothetical protein
MGIARYSIVVPLFNEQEVLSELCIRLRAAATRLDGPTEIIFLNDGSIDGTLGILRALQLEDKAIRVVSLWRHFGHQAAIAAGLHYAKGHAVAVLNGNLQDPPELLPDLFAKLEEGWDVAYRVRQQRGGALLKRLSDWLLHRLTDIDIPLDAGDFCAMRRRVVDVLNRLPETDRFGRGLRAWVGFRQIGVSDEREGRQAGMPQYTSPTLIPPSLGGLLRRGYNLVAIDPVSGAVLWNGLFDTLVSPSESTRLAEAVRRLPMGAIVAAAVKDEASGLLTDEAVAALRSLGSREGIRGRYRVSHLLVGVKGAPPGTAIEQAGYARLTATLSPAVGQLGVEVRDFVLR